MKARNIGLEIQVPKQSCKDKNCPFHGNLSCHGRNFVGTVISAKMQKTANIEMPRRIFSKKYERYEKKRSRIKAHNPECINAKEGDIVRIAESRPLSKTKNFVIVEKLGQRKGFVEIMEALEEAKVKEKKEVEVKGDESTQS